jgi:hypothetical protein
MDSVIKSAMKPHHKVSIKILREGKAPLVYADYSLRLSRMFGDLSKTIKSDLEGCESFFSRETRKNEV